MGTGDEYVTLTCLFVLSVVDMRLEGVLEQGFSTLWTWLP